MAVCIFRELLCLILRDSIYDARESDIQVKSYSHLNFLRGSVVQFWASRYIIGMDHTFESKVMAVWICRELPWSISRVSINYACESDIRVKSYRHLNFSRAFVVQFWVSRYIMGVDHIFDSNVMPIWICRELPYSILRVSIYDTHELDIQEKSYGHLNFWRASVVQFLVSRYISSVDLTFESKVMAVWICREFPCSISRVSIYYAGESDIRVKSYSHLNFSRASIVQFWWSWYIKGLNRTSELKVIVVWFFSELPLFNFERLDISWASIIHSSQKLWPFEFSEIFRCSIFTVSLYHGRRSYIRVKSYGHLNF